MRRTEPGQGASGAPTRASAPLASEPRRIGRGQVGRSFRVPSPNYGAIGPKCTRVPSCAIGRHVQRLRVIRRLSLNASSDKRRVHYAWVVVATVFVVLLCTAGVRATPSVLIVPLEREFGWSPALISSAVSINLLLYGLVGPFAATIMQYFGIRRTVLASLLVIAADIAQSSPVR